MNISKPGTKIILPALGFAVEKIEVVSHSSGTSYANVDMNVYVGETAVSTPCIGTAATSTFEIAAENQAAGNVYELVIGSNGGKDYTVGIQKPFGLHGESAVLLKLQNKTAVTSGIYERYFEFEGKIYHHVLDPKTGYPTDNGIQSVTILANRSALADSLSTACLVLGVEEGTKLAKSFGAEAVFLLSDGSIVVTENLKVDQNGPTPTVTYK